jgi:hypothetical protein
MSGRMAISGLHAVLGPHKIVRAGMAVAPQQVRLQRYVLEQVL